MFLFLCGADKRYDMPRLIALTDDARQAIGGPELTLATFPFRVGRERRNIVGNPTVSVERRASGAPNNDVYIVELTDLHNVSREHVAIDNDDEGRYFLTDRGSALGTIVEGHTLGGNRAGGVTELHDHDVIIIGNPTSPFIFKFRT